MGLVRQSAPAEDILLPGSACGMPKAPEEALYARGFQPLSRCHNESRQPNWPDHPRAARSARAAERGSRELLRETAAAARCLAVAATAARLAAEARAARFAAPLPRGGCCRVGGPVQS